MQWGDYGEGGNYLNQIAGNYCCVQTGSGQSFDHQAGCQAWPQVDSLSGENIASYSRVAIPGVGGTMICSNVCSHWRFLFPVFGPFQPIFYNLHIFSFFVCILQFLGPS